MPNDITSLMNPVPPGVSWTAPEKSRPWQNPPKLVNIGDVAGYYVDAIGNGDTLNDLLDALETGVPLAVIGEALMMAGVSRGMHTLDAGILVMPVIIEMLQTVAEMHGTKFVIYPDDYDKEVVVSNRVARLAVQKAMKKLEGEDITEAEQEVPPAQPKGLMAKKQKEVV